MRGLAVLAVVAYHADFSWASGGFLGVSLFFTLSGFLITSLLLTNAAAESGAVSDGAGSGLRAGVSLSDFWRRRFRRLLPASLLAILLAAAFTVQSGTRDQLSRFDGDALAALGYAFNWRQVTTQAGYTGAASDPSALQHFWSLAIEEQFYILFPLLFAGIYWTRRGHRESANTILSLVVLVAMAVSFALAFAWGGADNADRVYFGTDTRAFEILAGVLAALLMFRFRPSFERARMVAALNGLGIAALVLLGVLSSTMTTFSPWLYDGGFGIVSFISVAAIMGIVVGGPAERLLANKVLVGTGKISYGLYLYHWPVFLYLTATRTGISNPWLLAAFQVSVSVGLAVVSYRFVETPIRRGAGVPEASRRFAAGSLAGIGVVALVAFGAGAVQRPEAADLVASITATIPGELPTTVEPEVAGAVLSRNVGNVGNVGNAQNGIGEPDELAAAHEPPAAPDSPSESSSARGRSESATLPRPPSTPEMDADRRGRATPVLGEDPTTAPTAEFIPSATASPNTEPSASMPDSGSPASPSTTPPSEQATSDGGPPETASPETAATSDSPTSSTPTPTTVASPAPRTQPSPTALSPTTPPPATSPSATTTTAAPATVAPTTTVPPTTSTTSTTPPTTVPPPVSASRVLVLGDSLSHDLFPFLSEALSQRAIASEVIGGPSEGPLEADVAWLDELRSSLASFDPDLVVFQSCCFGRRGVGSGPELRANDGTVVEADSPEMFAAHEELVRIMADEIRAVGARMVLIEVPISDPNPFYGPLPERMATFQQGYDRLVADQAWIETYDWNPILAPNGVYSETGVNHLGETVTFRLADGLHLTDIANALVAVNTAEFLAEPVAR